MKKLTKYIMCIAICLTISFIFNNSVKALNCSSITNTTACYNTQGCDWKNGKCSAICESITVGSNCTGNCKWISNSSGNFACYTIIEPTSSSSKCSSITDSLICERRTDCEWGYDSSGYKKACYSPTGLKTNGLLGNINSIAKSVIDSANNKTTTIKNTNYLKCTDFDPEFCPSPGIDYQGTPCKISYAGNSKECIPNTNAKTCSEYCKSGTFKSIDDYGNTCYRITSGANAGDCGVSKQATYESPKSCSQMSESECVGHDYAGNLCKWENGECAPTGATVSTTPSITNPQTTYKISKKDSSESESGGSGFSVDGTIKACGFELPKNLPHFTSQIYDIVKVMVPVVIIILGMFDFLKVVMANKEENAKKEKDKFIRRLIAGVVVFFVMVAVEFVFNHIDVDEKNGMISCMKCILSNNNCNGKNSSPTQFCTSYQENNCPSTTKYNGGSLPCTPSDGKCVVDCQRLSASSCNTYNDVCKLENMTCDFK